MSRNILVIDDDPKIAKLFKLALERDGFEVRTAMDGEEGLKLQHQHQADLVITDILMPNKEGLETISELRREYPNVKIIAISGGGLIPTRNCLHLAQSFGADRIFPKPVDLDMLLSTVHELTDIPPV